MSMSGTNQDDASQISAATENTPSTSAKESNENDIHMKPEKAAFQEKDENASD